MEAMVEEIGTKHLLPRQKEAFLCCSRCCDAVGSVRQLESCVQSCSASSTAAQKMIQGQIQEFQERFQRIAYRCQDVAKDSVPFNASPSEQAKAQTAFNACMETSGQDLLARVPKLKADVVAALNRM
ncbi:MAG: hypothetical protein WDW36_000602 [Sanguina aurantia]